MRDARWLRAIDARRWAAFALPGAFAALASCASFASSACGTSTAQCDCPDQAIVVHVPDSLASSVIDVTPSGVACAGVTPSCAAMSASGACTVYRIAPTIDGTCHVDVDFSSGGNRFSADLRVVHGSGCCAGLVTDPPSASDVDVPDAADAGGGE